MHTITQFGEYHQGAQAGRSLAELFRELGTDINDLPRPTDEELNAIFEFIWAQNTIDRPYHSVMGFLTEILRRERYSTGIIQILGTSELIDLQQDYAPVSTLPIGSGIVMFGTWKGDLSDGDAWCLDIQADRVCCVPIGCPETKEEARISAYAAFHDLHYLEAHLRKAAELRGLLPRSR